MNDQELRTKFKTKIIENRTTIKFFIQDNCPHLIGTFYGQTSGADNIQPEVRKLMEAYINRPVDYLPTRIGGEDV